MDIAPALQTPREDTSESLEAITTPTSIAGDIYLRQISDPTTPTSGGLPSPRTRPDAEGDLCSCVQTQASNVATLHGLTCREIFDRFDLAMKSITSTLETSERFIACGICEKSFSSLLLTLSTIELIFKLFEQLTMTNRDPSPLDEQRLIPCSLGDYKVTREESQAIRNVLVKMTLSKASQTLKALQNLVGGPADTMDQQRQGETPQNSSEIQETRINGLCRLCLKDRDYIIGCLERRDTALEALMARVIV